MDIQKYTNIKNYLKQLIVGTEFENNVFAVGGCCRDEMLGSKTIKDLDLVVSLENGGIRFANWLESHKYTIGSVVTYPRFGTAMFRLKQFPDDDLEVVQTRTEVYTSDSRKPDTAYGSIKQDCLRRDLTINAIYYDISNSKMLDVCGTSFDDIKNHIIRTPCDPDQTYIDDPLRIMRCVRFAMRLNWNIEPYVFESMKRNIDRLSVISKERINDEFTKIIKSNVKGLDMLISIGANKYIFPNLNICDNLFKGLSNIYMKPLYVKLGLIGIFNDNMEYDMQNLKYSNDDINYVKNLIRLYNEFCNISNRKEFRKFLYDCKNVETYIDVIDICSALNGLLINLQKYTNYNVNEDFNMFNYRLPVNGNDIMNILHIGPSKKVKDMITNLLNYVFEHPNVTNEEIIKQIK